MPKQLLPLAGRAVLRWTCETLAEAGLRQVVVVHAPGQPVAQALAGLRVRFAVNAAPGSGMADSLRVGLCAVGAAATGVLVCLADHPLVSAATVRALLRAHRAQPEAIWIPVHGGRRGHPALFPAAALRELGPGCTLRDVRERRRGSVRELPVDDAGVLFDMDTPGDYRAALALAGAARGAAG